MKTNKYSKYYSWTFNVVGLVICLFLTCSCSGGTQYHMPAQTNDGWQTASLSDVGMDLVKMEELMVALDEHPDHWITVCWWSRMENWYSRNISRVRIST